MSVEAVYRGRRAMVRGDYCISKEDADRLGEPYGGWVGVLLDYGDGLVFGVLFSDPELEVDPDDDEWDAAKPLLDPIPGATFETLPDGTTVLRSQILEPSPIIMRALARR